MKRTCRVPLGAALLCLVWTAPIASNADTVLKPGTGPRHGIAMHGEPKYGPDARAFDYIDPYAEPGGELVLGEMGSFDNLNPFNIQGTTPPASESNSGYAIQHHTIESLMIRSNDEPFTIYGLLAESIETPADRSWVEFRLRKNARFSDGSPVTVEDVVFSFETLREKGRPNLRRSFGQVVELQTPGDNRIRFVFKDSSNQELPLILGFLPVLSKEDWTGKDFSKTTLSAPLGSGPYMVSKVDSGRSISFRHNPDYWGKDLFVRRGHNNFDVIRYEYFRDTSAMFEAFKRGQIMFRKERDAKTWATGYRFTATENGQVARAEIPHGRPADMYGFVFNTRRELFQDIRVRQALTLLFDFEWINQNLYFGSFERVQSYFDNSELGTFGRPADDRERALLAAFPDAVNPEILESGWTAPVNGTDENVRANKRQALQLLRSAGWTVESGRLVNAVSGRPFTFEIIMQRPREERVALTFADALRGIGVDAKVRVIDSAQYHERQAVYDFDMMPFRWTGTLSPGNEQAFRYGSKEADLDGTFNVAGVKSNAVDSLIAAITRAKSREDLVAATRALDRVLLSGNYIIPFYYTPVDRIAYWTELQPSESGPITGVTLDTWWMLPDH